MKKNSGKKSRATVPLRAWFRFFPHLSEDLVSYSMKGYFPNLILLSAKNNSKGVFNYFYEVLKY